MNFCAIIEKNKIFNFNISDEEYILLFGLALSKQRCNEELNLKPREQSGACKAV